MADCCSACRARQPFPPTATLPMVHSYYTAAPAAALRQPAGAEQMLHTAASVECRSTQHSRPAAAAVCASPLLHAVPLHVSQFVSCAPAGCPQLRHVCATLDAAALHHGYRSTHLAHPSDTTTQCCSCVSCSPCFIMSERNLISTLEEGRSSTCFLPRFSALYIVFCGQRRGGGAGQHGQQQHSTATATLLLRMQVRLQTSTTAAPHQGISKNRHASHGDSTVPCTCGSGGRQRNMKHS